MGFPVSAFERMRFGAEALAGGFVADHFELPAASLAGLLERADAPLRTRLLLLEVWGRTCLGGEDAASVRDHLRRHVRIAPVG
jgi:hypothetical protein